MTAAEFWRFLADGSEVYLHNRQMKQTQAREGWNSKQNVNDGKRDTKKNPESNVWGA